MGSVAMRMIVMLIARVVVLGMIMVSFRAMVVVIVVRALQASAYFAQKKKHAGFTSDSHFGTPKFSLL